MNMPALHARRRLATMLLVCCALSGHFAAADVLLLTNGLSLEGEVLEETRDYVKFRCVIEGIWTTHTVRRGEVYSLTRVDGDQSDLSGAPARGASTTGSTRGPKAPAEESVGPKVAVISLHGQVGGLIDSGISGTIDLDSLRICLEEAKEIDAEAVILDIHSPGGSVAEMESICELIIAWHDQLRIIAFAREAYSAAAIISLSCRELAVHPAGQLGAAVIIERKGGEISAVKEKFASPHYAKQRQYMAASGQSYEVVAAMTILETELWWNEQEGFRTEAPPADEAVRWKKIDTDAAILTLTGDEALEYGVAMYVARSVREIVEQAGLDAEAEIVMLDDIIEREQKRLDHQIGRIIGDFDKYLTALGELVGAMNAYARSKGQSGQSDVRRAWSKANLALRRIEKVERSLLQKRIDVADQVMDRLAEDKQLIGKINRLVSSGSVNDYNEAVARINEVIDAWKQLLR